MSNTIIREVEHNPKKQSQEETRPTIITWKDQKMIRTQSIRATVREILQVSKALDVIHINIIGNPSTGKTTLAKTIGHLIHKMSDIPFAVRLFTKKELLDFEATLKKLTPANYVLIFDDLSFLGASATKKQIEIVKQAMTEIRHLEGGRDVKIISIKVSHYTLGVDKFLRQNDFSFFTSVGSSEMDNMEKIVGSKNMPKIYNFKNIYSMAITKAKFTYKLGQKGTFTYGYKTPFVPALFWNNISLRHIVWPMREWIDNYCDTCALATGDENFKNIVNIEQYKKEMNEAFGESTFKRATKNLSLRQGVNVDDARVISCERNIEKSIATGKVTMDEIRAGLGLKKANTKMRKQLPDEIINARLPDENDITNQKLDHDLREMVQIEEIKEKIDGEILNNNTTEEKEDGVNT